MRARLLAHGFTEEFLGEDQPPATHYHLGGEPSGFYAEFLTPLVDAGGTFPDGVALLATLVSGTRRKSAYATLPGKNVN